MRAFVGPALVTIGGLVMVAGSVLPWAEGDVGFSLGSFIGTRSREGTLTSLIGPVLVVLAIVDAVVEPRRRLRPAVVALAVAALILVAYAAVTLPRRLVGWEGTTLGVGLLVVAFGAVLACVGAVWMRPAPIQPK